MTKPERIDHTKLGLEEGDNLTVFILEEDRIVLVDDNANKYELDLNLPESGQY